jgi:hypothetical protein
MTSEERFARLWADVETGVRDATSVHAYPGMDAELAADVLAADALRRFGAALAEPDVAAVWTAMVPSLTAPERTRRLRAVPGTRVRARRSPLRRTLRVAAMAAAAVVLLATASMAATPGSVLYPVRRSVERIALALSPSDRGLYLRMAEARLGDLEHALREGPASAAPELARALVSGRGAALAEGADVSDLDGRIRLEVPPALDATPPGVASIVRTILGDLLPAGEEGSLDRGDGPDHEASGSRGSREDPEDRSHTRGHPGFSTIEREHRSGMKTNEGSEHPAEGPGQPPEGPGESGGAEGSGDNGEEGGGEPSPEPSEEPSPEPSPEPTGEPPAEQGSGDGP